MNKRYFVIFQDEWNNLYDVGRYDDLDSSIDDVNMFLEVYNVKLNKGDIREYPSSFNTAFDLDISSLFQDRDDLNGLMVRGFIFEGGEQ